MPTFVWDLGGDQRGFVHLDGFSTGAQPGAAALADASVPLLQPLADVA